MSLQSLNEERQDLLKRLVEVNNLIDKAIQEEYENLVKNILDGEQKDQLEEEYRYLLKNIDTFRSFLTNILSGISSKYSNGECTNRIIHQIVRDYIPNQYRVYRGFRDWLDSLIFRSICEYTRKLDGEEYIFQERHKMNNFFKGL